MDCILFTNCTLIDFKSKTLQKGYNVVVKNNLIEAVSTTMPEIKNAQVIDLKDKLLMPGFIDAHVHVTASELDLANEHIPTSEVSVQAARFMEDMLMRGFTTIRDAGGADLGLANALEKGLIHGPRLFYCGKAISQTGGHGDFRKPVIGDLCSCSTSASNISVIADGIAAVRKAVRNEVRKGATHIKIMASGGVASPTDQVTNKQFSVAEIKAIVDEANNAGLYVMAHAYTHEAIVSCVTNGVRTIEHGNRLNEETAKIMKQYGAYLVPTLVVYESLAALGPKNNYPPESIAKIEQVRRAGIEAIKIARRAGIKIGFGTDLLGVEGQRWQAKEFVIRGGAEEPFDTIYSATVVNAEILNQSGKLGVIAPGAYADLVVVDGNPLQDISLLSGQGESLDLIMKNGIIYKNRLVA
jgi:imidazolonepropionase-like amidohydrolase